jgi:site-specific recombinase XerD
VTKSKNDHAKLTREIFVEDIPDEPISWQILIDDYIQSIEGKSPSTITVYSRILRQFVTWLSALPGHGAQFRAEQFTRSALEIYLSALERQKYSVSHRERVKAAVSGFSRWLIEDRALLRRNPTRGIHIASSGQLAPRELELEQRLILRDLVERAEDSRGEAIFALGYWAGCRISDVSWLRMENTHIGPKIGLLHIGYKGGKMRDLDLLNEVRRPLYDYLHYGNRNEDSPFVFTSQRSERLTEDGIHQWFQALKASATKEEWEFIKDITFHDLRHDFAHRARQAGWSLEEIAYYLGHTTKQGTPAIQTTVRYTQVSRRQLKDKLQLLKG